jgi:hypothetical protein
VTWGRIGGRIGATFAVLALASVVAMTRADPAAADPPVPTDYRSTVDALEPAADGVRAAVVGGGAFLELTVEPGHQVMVTGYQGEPYLLFRFDGTVQRNRRSPATYAKESRDVAPEPPPDADVGAEPDWETVADDGAYAWHDHSIHWMGSGRPDGAEPGEWTRPWVVDIEVDGTPTRITGTLALVDGVSPLPWLALGLAAAGLVVWGSGLAPRDLPRSHHGDPHGASAHDRGDNENEAGAAATVGGGDRRWRRWLPDPDRGRTRTGAGSASRVSNTRPTPVVPENSGDFQNPPGGRNSGPLAAEQGEPSGQQAERADHDPDDAERVGGVDVVLHLAELLAVVVDRLVELAGLDLVGPSRLGPDAHVGDRVVAGGGVGRRQGTGTSVVTRPWSMSVVRATTSSSQVPENGISVASAT